MSTTGVEVGGRQPAWQVARLMVATSLHYDARVNATAAVLPYAQRVRGELVAALSASAGAHLDDHALRQVFMPRALGGFQVDDPVATAVRARIAHIIERGPSLRAALAQLAPEGTPAEALRAAEAMDDADTTLDLLRTQGVRPRAYGLPDMGKPLADPLRPPCPARHLQRAYNSAAGRASLSDLLHQALPRDRARLRERACINVRVCVCTCEYARSL